MQIQTIDIEGFRSLRNPGGKLQQLSVIVGPNGVGKSNLYRSLELIKFAAQRQLARAPTPTAPRDVRRSPGEHRRWTETVAIWPPP